MGAVLRILLFMYYFSCNSARNTAILFINDILIPSFFDLDKDSHIIHYFFIPRINSSY